jgi:L-amino acid N-acyltransferase
MDGQENDGGIGKTSSARMIEIALRPAVESDLAAINDIYNYYVEHSTCTYQEQPETIGDRFEWFHNHGHAYPVTIAEHNGQVVGWSSISPYHSRSAYRHTIENSVYVRHGWHRRGIGSLLLEDVINKSRTLGYHAIIAAIDSDQTQSIALHAKYNFQHSGRLEQVGRKFGQWLDVIYMELFL